MRTKTHTILCLLLVVVTGTFGQNIDSLKTELKNAKSDSVKCNILTSIGSAFYYKGNTAEAIPYFSEIIKLQEKLGNKKEVAVGMVNIAALYINQRDFSEALNQLNKSYSLSTEINYKEGQIASLVYMGESYNELKKHDDAFDVFSRALKMSIEINDSAQVWWSYYGIGYVYAKRNEHNKSIDSYEKGLAICKRLNIQAGIQRGINSISTVLCNQKKYEAALPYALEALKIANSSGNIQQVMMSAGTLKHIYSKTNQPAKALQMYELEITMRDSVNSEKNRKAVIRNQIQTEYDKKALADSLRADNEKNIIVVKKNAEIEHQQNQKMVLYVGLALVIIFSFVLFNRFQLIQKQKQVIEHHQKEITDSINYAKRLQEAILPSQNQFNNLLPENFVYYRPKDIVAGDFYWLENVDDTVYFAAADCTGHGVPGAMVSMVCSNALTRVVLEYGITEPGKILDEVRKIVIATFEKSGTDIKDGMDISLCALNKNTNELKWAGANNPLWYFQDGKMNEVKADKQPIGKCDNPVPFTTHSILLQKGDSVFIFTDGYADQFGGPKGKKFMYKQMKELIQKHTGEHMLSQKLHLDVAFGNWMNVNDQVDDVCVIGVRV